jgi:tRNA-2-methylthio-N6-dimethylallyladenosine synthase
MNEYDSDRLRERLEKAGYESTTNPKKADLILLNSCSIREKAEQKLFSALGRYAVYKRTRPGLRLVVAGCTAQLKGEEILARVPDTDLVMGTDQLDRFEGWLESETPSLEPEARLLVSRAKAGEFRFLPVCPSQARPSSVSTNVTIMKGCDNRCAYCVVPAARGPQIDRPEREILADVDRLVAAGAKEIVLVGQNVNVYQGAGGGFARILEQVAARPGVCRVRFTTSHPRDLDLATVEAVARSEVICPHFHLPVQSGSNRVLRKMGRGYTRETYLEKVGWIRDRIPAAAISTDVIVGFPSETDNDFDETMRLLDEVGYSFIYSFCYSAREGTRAASMEDSPASEVKSARLHRLQERQSQMTRDHLASFVGETVEVLVEGSSRRGGGQLMGRTPTFEIVNFTPNEEPGVTAEGARLKGEVVPVEIVAAGKHTLEGKAAWRQPRAAGSNPAALQAEQG